MNQSPAYGWQSAGSRGIDPLQGDSPLDCKVLNELRSLQRPGQPSLLRRLAERYASTARESLRVLRDAVQRNDAQAVREAAHTMKSSSASIGAKGLAKLLGSLEMMGRSGAIEGSRELLYVLEAEFAAVCDALRTESFE